MPQLIVVVDVLVAERNAEHPLPNQRRYKVLDQFRAAAIDEALGETGQSARSPDPSLSTAAPPASDVIARHQTATTPRPSTAANSNSSGPRRSALHSFGIGALRESLESRCCTTTFADSPPRCVSNREISGLGTTRPERGLGNHRAQAGAWALPFLPSACLSTGCSADGAGSRRRQCHHFGF
jgi:hypothetical protein